MMTMRGDPTGSEARRTARFRSVFGQGLHLAIATGQSESLAASVIMDGLTLFRSKRPDDGDDGKHHVAIRRHT
jgi:hypothetical protein